MAIKTESVFDRGRDRPQVRRRHRQRGGRRVPLTFEQLETRALLTIVFPLFFGPNTDVRASNNGQGLQDPKVNLIFAGNWAPYAASEAKISDAVRSIINGPYLTGLTQYSTSGTATMGVVGFNTTQFIPTIVPQDTNPVTYKENDSKLQTYVQQSISTFGVPIPPSGDLAHCANLCRDFESSGLGGVSRPKRLRRVQHSGNIFDSSHQYDPRLDDGRRKRQRRGR